MKYKTRDGTTLHYSQTGKDSPSLIFMHGLNANKTIWNDVIKNLSYHTVCMDLRGHGESEKPYNQERYDIKRFIQDIEELRKNEDVGEYVLIGHSFGGMIAMQHEISKKSAKGLVLISTSADVTPTFIEDKFGKNILEQIKDKVEKIERVVDRNHNLNMESYGDTYNVWMEELLSMTPHAALSCIETILDIDMTNELENIETPVKIIHGKKDEIIPFEEGKKLYKNISQATLTLIEEGYHQPMLDHSQKISKAIEDFMDSLAK